MNIEFPERYHIHEIVPTMYDITVPNEYAAALLNILKQQRWVVNAFPFRTRITVIISEAYEVNSDQAHEALCRLCEHVMQPAADVDIEIWGEVLKGGE